MSAGGGKLQLVALGRQDLYLVGNPQTTWFKQVYRRYTNFSVESLPITFEGDVDFGKRFTCVIPKKGDLLSSLILEVTLPRITPTGTDTSWVNSIGHAMIKEMTLEIGGVEVDKHTGEWMEIWSSLTLGESKRTGFYNMIGKQQAFTDDSQPGPLKLYIPLRFWFCKDIGLSLPLVALQAHDVRITIQMRGLQELFFRDSLINNPNQTVPIPITKPEIVMFGDYVYLDIEERRRFVSNKHEYLIEQIQINPPTSISASDSLANITLNFNHAVKELVWVVKQNRMADTHEWFNFSSLPQNASGIRTDNINNAIIRFDGYDRFPRRDASYFRLVQPWQRHTSIPDDFIYLYSFSLRPEDSQPSGSFNASRINNVVLSFDMNRVAALRQDCTVSVYAVTHNVLRIVAGMGGILFTA